ncbi:uncharacterized protein LOC129750518 [Uranotaenia lowii]|uniref:uncharacterized protein LOC129750518 n=1 Tax=Uranotaenia lowii TaxID=190385 RepID=UPI002478B8E3|nr:uncharacterized protein LOC129750518 [Uranotaenia lowii]
MNILEIQKQCPKQYQIQIVLSELNGSFKIEPTIKYASSSSFLEMCSVVTGFGSLAVLFLLFLRVYTDLNVEAFIRRLLKIIVKWFLFEKDNTKYVITLERELLHQWEYLFLKAKLYDSIVIRHSIKSSAGSNRINSRIRNINSQLTRKKIKKMIQVLSKYELTETLSDAATRLGKNLSNDQFSSSTIGSVSSELVFTMGYESPKKSFNNCLQLETPTWEINESSC